MVCILVAIFNRGTFPNMAKDILPLLLHMIQMQVLLPFRNGHLSNVGIIFLQTEMTLLEWDYILLFSCSLQNSSLYTEQFSKHSIDYLSISC